MPAKRSTPQQYQAAYTRLNQIAQQLEEGSGTLDEMLPLLQEAQQAYAICQERLQALRTLLAQSPTSTDTASTEKQ